MTVAVWLTLSLPPKMDQNVSLATVVKLVEVPDLNLDLGFKLTNFYHPRIYIPWLYTFTNTDARTKMTFSRSKLKKHQTTLNMKSGNWEGCSCQPLPEVIVHESNDEAVTVRAKGIGTPVMCRESFFSSG